MAYTKQECARALTASILALAGAAFAPQAGALSFTVGGGMTENSVGANSFFADGVNHNFQIGPLTLDLQGAAAGIANHRPVGGGEVIRGK